MKLFPLLVCVAFMLVITGCRTTPVMTDQAEYDIESAFTPKSRILSKNGNTFEVFLGSSSAKFNGGWIHLVEEMPPEEWTISSRNYENVIVPLLDRSTGPAKPAKVILIDPGHGGDELGAVGTKYQEKMLNLALALRIRDELVRRGFTVRMTRDNDLTMGLTTRGELSGKIPADLFISVHHNASTNHTGTGVETYAMTPHGCRSSSGGAIPKNPTLSNQYNDASLNLAQEIQSRLVKATGGPDRGVKFARFRVLVTAHCPAVLIEAGFISTPQEELKIASPERQKRVAVAVADAVVAYNQLFGVEH